MLFTGKEKEEAAVFVANIARRTDAKVFYVKAT